MPSVYQTLDRNGRPYPKWRFSYTDWQGKRRTGTGFTNKKQTERLAGKIETEHEEIRKGYRPPPKTHDRHMKRSFEEVKEKYLAWGESQGGRGGRPWGREHLRIRKMYLKWWGEKLDVHTLGDLLGTLSPVEEALQEILNAGRAGKTVQNYAETLKSFCRWCVRRGFLPDDPLKDLLPYDITPKEPRRALDLEEIGKILRMADQYRGLLYEVALCTGLRANELRCLQIADLDVEGCGFQLHAEWTKNRKPGFQPLPKLLVEKLKKFAERQTAELLYEERYPRRSATRNIIPETPLLYIEDSPGVTLDRVMEAAEVEKKTREGKIDFHALRTTFGTLLNMVGATEKEIQHLMRQRPRTITFDRYVKTSDNRLRALIDSISDMIMTAKESETCEKSAKQVVGLDVSLYGVNGSWRERVGVEPTWSIATPERL